MPIYTEICSPCISQNALMKDYENKYFFLIENNNHNRMNINMTSFTPNIFICTEIYLYVNYETSWKNFQVNFLWNKVHYIFFLQINM